MCIRNFFGKISTRCSEHLFTQPNQFIDNFYLLTINNYNNHRYHTLATSIVLTFCIIYLILRPLNVKIFVKKKCTKLNFILHLVHFDVLNILIFFFLFMDKKECFKITNLWLWGNAPSLLSLCLAYFYKPRTFVYAVLLQTDDFPTR